MTISSITSSAVKVPLPSPLQTPEANLWADATLLTSTEHLSGASLADPWVQPQVVERDMNGVAQPAIALGTDFNIAVAKAAEYTHMSYSDSRGNAIVEAPASHQLYLLKLNGINKDGGATLSVPVDAAGHKGEDGYDKVTISGLHPDLRAVVGSLQMYDLRTRGGIKNTVFGYHPQMLPKASQSVPECYDGSPIASLTDAKGTAIGPITVHTPAYSDFKYKLGNNGDGIDWAFDDAVKQTALLLQKSGSNETAAIFERPGWSTQTRFLATTAFDGQGNPLDIDAPGIAGVADSVKGLRALVSAHSLIDLGSAADRNDATKTAL